MAEGHSATVKLEGDSSSLERSFARSAQKAREFDASIQKVEATSKRANAVEMQRAALQDRTAKSAVNMQKTTERVGFALHQVVGQTASFNQALQGVLGTFGGWGVAIGALVGTVLHFAEAQDEAHKKAVKLNDELRKQAGLKREAQQDQETETKLALMRHAREKDERREAKAREQIAINNREEKEALDEMVTLTEARGKSAEGARRRQAELHEQTLREQAAVSGFEKQRELIREADAVAHEEKLRRLEVEGRREKELTGHKKKQLTFAQEIAKLNTELMKRVPFGDSPSFGRTGSDTLFDIEAAGGRAANGMPGLSLSGGPAMMRDPNAAVNAESQRNAVLREVQLEREQALEFDLQAELSRIEREKQAQTELLLFNERIAANDSERLTAREQQRQVLHEAELARIEAEKTARIQAQEKIANAIATTGSVLGAGAKLAAMAAEATGASAKKQARVAQIGMGIQAMAIGALEVVKAAASYASLNIPQGIAHTAAAAVAFTEGGLLLAGKIGRSGGGGASAGGGGGFGGSNFGSSGGGGGGGSTGGGKLPGADSPIPGSPGPQAPRTGGGSQGNSGGSVVVDLRGANFNGTGGRKEFARFLDEVLEEGGQNRRPRRTVG